MLQVAVIIDNLVQFYSIRRGIDDLLKRDVNVDIYVPEDPESSELEKYTSTNIRTLGYEVHNRAAGKRHYRVVLEPYPKLEHKKSLQGITYDYRIKFKYGLVSTKPNPEHSPEWTVFYDAMLVHSTYEYELLQIYTTTHLIDPLKYDKWKQQPRKKGAKRRVLYMPTFSDVNPNNFPAIEDAFRQLKKKYSILIKAHHATQFRESEIKHNEFLHQVADEIYDSSTPIGEVLSHADAVLTGNSGSAFEAMYLGIPVSIYLDDLSKYDLGITSLQHRLINDNVIPWTDTPDRIGAIIEESFKRLDIQNIAADKLFRPSDITIENFSSVIEGYLKRNPAKDSRHQLRNQLREYLYSLKKERAQLHKNVTQLQSVVTKLTDDNKKLKSINMRNEKRIFEYENSTSWRITEPLRKISRLIKSLRRGL